MAYTIKSPVQSFVTFGQGGLDPHCLIGDIDYCLPVAEEQDVAFQFTLEGDTEGEAAGLCTAGDSGVQVGIVLECDDAAFLLQFTGAPQRFRVSPRQVVYNWSNMPGMLAAIAVGECFRIRIKVGDLVFCSDQCFERIPDEEKCFTSKVEYGSDDNSFGFNYCLTTPIEDDAAVDCAPTVIEFFNVPTLTVPITAELRAKYGPLPNAQAWIRDPNGVLTNIGVQIQVIGYPATAVQADFGGPATGFLRIS